MKIPALIRRADGKPPDLMEGANAHRSDKLEHQERVLKQLLSDDSFSQDREIVQQYQRTTSSVKG
jgi:hypothetical protein